MWQNTVWINVKRITKWEDELNYKWCLHMCYIINWGFSSPQCFSSDLQVKNLEQVISGSWLHNTVTRPTNCYHTSIKRKPSKVDYWFKASSFISEVTILGWDGEAGQDILIGSDWELEDLSIMRLTCPEAGVFNTQSMDPLLCILYKIILHIKQWRVANWLESFNNMSHNLIPGH